MAAGAEADELRRIAQLGLPLVVLALEGSKVDEQGLRGGLAGQWRERPGLPDVVDHRRLQHETGHCLTCPMSAAWSAMVVPHAETTASSQASSITKRRSASGVWRCCNARRQP